MTDMGTAIRQDDKDLTGPLRRMLRAQRALHEEAGAAHPETRVIDERRRDLVLQLTAYRDALATAHLTVPRAITDELQLQALLLARSAPRDVTEATPTADVDLDRLADDGAPLLHTRT